MAECVEKDPTADVNGESSEATHSKALMSGLNELRLADKLLDVTLLVEGVRMKAHRVVLAACSDYFAAMFTDPMKEATQSEIELIGVTARGMQLLLEYAYTSKLEIDRDNIQDILSTATHVQMNSVVQSCSTYLECQLDIENCVDIAELADLYELGKLLNKTYRYICSRFSEFAKTPEINNLKPEQLEYILSCDYPVDCPETNVLKIVAEYCVQNRVTLEIARRLFTRIRFDQIKQIDIHVWPRFDVNVDAYVHSPYFNVMRAVGFQQKKSAKKKGNYDVPNDILLSNMLTNARGMELAIVKIGGFHINGLHNQLSFALPNERKWHDLTSIPHIEQCNYGTAVLKNDLFVVGGSYDVCLKEYIHGFGFRYNSTKNKWTPIAQIQSDRCRFSLNAVGDHLYAVGGIFEATNDEYFSVPNPLRRVSNCERYNVEGDWWEFIPALGDDRSQHAGVGLGRYLYVSGGIERHQLVLASMWRYDTITARWEEKSPMLTPRADHVLLAIEGKIYACGGWYEETVSPIRALAETIDVYDILTDTWHFETKNPVPTFHSGITAVNTKIFFVGGLLSDETTNCSSSVQTYDLSTKQWSTHTEWQSAKPTWECTCASFYVPRCRDGI